MYLIMFSRLISNQKDVHGKIGKAFLLPKNKRNAVGLPKKDEVLSFSSKKDHYLIKIDEIDLYLFETQIGFLIYKVSIVGKDNADMPTIHEYIESTYQAILLWWIWYKLIYRRN